MIKKNNGKNIIDCNILYTYLNYKENEFRRDSVGEIINIISNGKNFFAEKQLDNFFKFDKYTSEKDI